jgi:nucleoside phosphorylase
MAMSWQPNGLANVNVAILTALPVEETAVIEAIGNCSVEPWYGRDLHLGEIVGQRVLVFPIDGIGNVAAAQAAELVTRVWNPTRLMLAGIAAGASQPLGDIRLGDVLVADQVVGYELAKVRPDHIERRYKVYQSDVELLNHARSLRSADWADRITTPRPDDPKGRMRPLVHIGPILTGDKVLADGATLRELRQAWPQAIGVEMEGLGVAHAAHRNGAGFLMVKAVCDLADDKKDDTWHLYASAAAAHFAIGVLGRSPVPDLERPRPTEPKSPTKDHQPMTPTVIQTFPDMRLKEGHFGISYNMRGDD